MKKMLLPFGLLTAAFFVSPSTGSAKLVLDLPPILAGTSNSCLEYAGCPSGPCYPGCPDPCQKCDLKCVSYSECLAGPCYPECAAINPCQPCCASDCDPCLPDCKNPCTSCVAFNDTGITTPAGGGEDADFGRDAAAKTSSDTNGWKGFSFTKIPGGDKTCVKDNVTGLTWSPDLGQSNWDGTSDVVTANSSLCGKTGWRLPTLRELLSLVAYNKINPAIDNDAGRGFFSDTQSAKYWTSDPVYSAVTQWGVDFNTGSTAYLDKSTLTFTTRIRLVTKN